MQSRDQAETGETGVMAPPPPYIEAPLPALVYLGAAVLMALLGGGFVIAFVLRDDGSAFGFGLVCLGAAGFAGWAFPSIRRSRLR
jgi:hypothetical protein